MYKARDDDADHGCRYVEFLGKTIDLGNGDTHYRRLFNLFAANLGHQFPISECLRNMEFETSRMNGDSPAEIKKAKQRLRKALERLRKRLTAAGLDQHVKIVRHKVWTPSPAGALMKEPSISMVTHNGASAHHPTQAA